MKIGGQKIPGKTLVLIASEAALIACGLLFASALHAWGADALGEVVAVPGVWLRFGIVIVVCELSLYYYDLYDLQVVSRRSVLFIRLLQALGSACLVLAVLYFCDPDLSLGRWVAAVAAPIIITFVAGWRLLVDASAPFLRRNERILVVGDGPAGSYLIEEILRRPELNIDVAGVLQEAGSREPSGVNPETTNSGGSSLRLQWSLRYSSVAGERSGSGGSLILEHASAGMGSAAAVADSADPVVLPEIVFPAVIGVPSDVERCVVSERIDRVVLAFSERRGNTPLKELLRLKFLGVKIEEAQNMYERITGRILLDHLSPSWLILADGFRKHRPVMAAKRALDIVVAAIGLAFAWPLMLLVALAVVLESKGPILFRQLRIGLDGRPFEILKFRSMRNEAQPRAASWTSDRDPRITRVGRFIRKSRLDELPQLLNVLRGDMSLVGPRPEQPTLAEMLDAELPYYDRRHCMRPGITGWAQVKYGYGATIAQSKIKLEHDLFYIKHLSLALDLAIIFETAKVLLSGRGAK
jgi:exopolysaccharide biosynthesis polyprenyl glycosylphosphotransferase